MDEEEEEEEEEEGAGEGEGDCLLACSARALRLFFSRLAHVVPGHSCSVRAVHHRLLPLKAFHRGLLPHFF